MFISHLVKPSVLLFVYIRLFESLVCTIPQTDAGPYYIIIIHHRLWLKYIIWGEPISVQGGVENSSDAVSIGCWWGWGSGSCPVDQLLLFVMYVPIWHTTII